MSLSVAASRPTSQLASSAITSVSQRRVLTRPALQSASSWAGTCGPCVLAPRGLTPPRARAQRLVVCGNAGLTEVLHTAAKVAEGLAVGTALTAAKAGIGAAEGLVAGAALGLIPHKAHQALKGGLHYEMCVVAAPPLFATPVGAAVGAFLPSNDLLHIANAGAEGAGIVAAASVVGVLFGCIAFVAYDEGRDENRLGMGGAAFVGGHLGGLAGTLAGLAYLIHQCV